MNFSQWLLHWPSCSTKKYMYRLGNSTVFLGKHHIHLIEKENIFNSNHVLLRVLENSDCKCQNISHSFSTWQWEISILSFKAYETQQLVHKPLIKLFSHLCLTKIARPLKCRLKKKQDYKLKVWLTKDCLCLPWCYMYFCCIYVSSLPVPPR